MSEQVVILGAGQAGAQLAISLRQLGFAGSITMLGDEPEPPYQRPPLSKKYLTGDVGADRAHIKPLAFYAQSGIDLRLGTRAVEIDRAARVVIDDRGNRLAYDKLAFCMGTRARPLPLPGADLAGVLYLRTLDDARRIREAGTRGGRAVVIGGGYIGLEVAASLRQLGCAVTVLEVLPRVLNRVVAEPVAAFYAGEHRRHGVDVRTSVALQEISGTARPEAVLAKDGTRWPADLIVIGIGAVPNDELARAAGLPVDNGIVVDHFGQTDDPAIWAAGDVTNHPSNLFARRLRLESVHNAMAQAKTVATAMLGKPVVYDEVPWFWSDQYDLKLQIAGFSAAGPEVLIRGDPSERAFSCLYLASGRLMALDAINRPGDFIAAKRLITEHRVLDPARAVDSSIKLADCVT
jgi:3-phenylpropionate/trans-cinnamate dioxygenase ferredoxin reductase subunit